LELAPLSVVQNELGEVDSFLTVPHDCRIANQVTAVHNGKQALDYLNNKKIYGNRTASNPI
jgi:hypothetical protein